MFGFAREEIARQRSAASYRKLHEAGKTEEAQRDLARLALVRQKREEVARKKEAEMKGQSCVLQWTYIDSCKGSCIVALPLCVLLYSKRDYGKGKKESQVVYYNSFGDTFLCCEPSIILFTRRRAPPC